MDNRRTRGTSLASTDTGAFSSPSLAYKLNLHAYPPYLNLIPSPSFSTNGQYRPSPALGLQILKMLTTRKPTAVGQVSEQVVVELLTGATLLIHGQVWTLSCQPLTALADALNLTWKPGYGIRCDDLATVAKKPDEGTLLFVTESKGTTAEHGLSRDTEGKMFYQLARTYEKMKLARSLGSTLRLGGVISAIVNHHSWIITMNGNDHTTSFAGGLPDAWMYPSRDLKEF